MRRIFHVLLAVTVVVLILLIDWPQRKRQLTGVSRRVRDALSQPHDGHDAEHHPVPPLALNTLSNGTTGAKLLTLPRLWLASAVLIILAAIALRPLLP